MKTLLTYLLIILFTFAFSYKTVKRITGKFKVVETCCSCDMDCESEKEASVEKDEITDPFYFFSFGDKSILIREELFLPSELVVNFTSANYSNLVYSPPEAHC